MLTESLDSYLYGDYLPDNSKNGSPLHHQIPQQH